MIAKSNRRIRVGQLLGAALVAAFALTAVGCTIQMPQPPLPQQELRR